MPICISRPKQAGNEPSADVDVSEIYNVHWDNTSGNGRFKHRGYRLYGYISYTRAAELGLSSGSHEYYRNDVKITIHEKYNTAAAYINDYKSLLLKAGEKPREQHNRSIRGETLTKRILRELDDGGKTRKELRDVLLAEKYSSTQIQGAINRMYRDGRIQYDKGIPAQKQLISIAKRDD